MGQEPGSLSGIGHYLLTMGVSLALVVGLAVGFLYLMRRFVPGPRGGRVIRVMESLSLEPRRSLHLVKVGETYILVGSTDGGIREIARFTADEIPEQATSGPSGLRFIDIIRGRRGKNDRS